MTQPGRLRAVMFLALFLAGAAAPLAAASAAAGEPPEAIITSPGAFDLYAPGDVVGLDGRRSFDPDGTIASYRWDLGDGSHLTGAEGNYTFASPGNYTVTLTVEDADGLTARSSMDIFVKFRSPGQIRIGFAPQSGGKLIELDSENRSGTVPTGMGLAINGEQYSFSPLLLMGPGNDTSIYFWDFGDGTTCTGREVRHSFDRPGTYNITMTIIDGDYAVRSTVQIQVSPRAAPYNGWVFLAFAVSLFLVVGFAAFLGGTELGLGLLFPVFIFLYSRIKQDHILDNYTRGQIHGYILANPGEHYSSIKSALNLNNGTLAYHLQRLENEQVIKSSVEGLQRRYYPIGMKVPEPNGRALTEVQGIVLNKIRETPGISQRDIAVLMGLSNPTVNYHIERLLAKGIIRRERAGMRYKCYLNEPVPGAPAVNDN